MKNRSSVPQRKIKTSHGKFSRSAMEEFGPGKRDIAICPSCSAMYYHKAWHHNMLRYKGDIGDMKEMNVSLCPACSMWKARTWEGEVHIEGVPAAMRAQVHSTVLSLADGAYKRDPMHRIFDIKETGKSMLLYVSENQLAVRIAHKLASSLKKHFSKPDIHHGKGGDAVLVTMEWIGH